MRTVVAATLALIHEHVIRDAVVYVGRTSRKRGDMITKSSVLDGTTAANQCLRGALRCNRHHHLAVDGALLTGVNGAWFRTRTLAYKS